MKLCSNNKECPYQSHFDTLYRLEAIDPGLCEGFLREPNSKCGLKPVNIRIVRVPEGEAPEEVRREWVGCEFSARGPEKKRTQEIFSSDPRFKSGFSVSTSEALGVLKEKSRRAEKWFRDNVEFKPLDYLFFNEEECEIV